MGVFVCSFLECTGGGYMQPINPVWLNIVNPTAYAQAHFLKQVTSQYIYEPSTNKFHPGGLYSEDIFGQIGSTQRLVTLGHIALNTNILFPGVFKNLIDLKPFYQSIMEGKVFAIWDDKQKNFVPAAKDDVGADSGYQFVIDHFHELVVPRSASPARSNMLNSIYKVREKGAAVIDRFLVAPAGLRDIKDNGGRVQIEEVNKHYRTMLSLAAELEACKNGSYLAKFYDGVKYNMQLTAYHIYEYWINFLNGKTGYIQRQYARRSITHGTRNVISAPSMQGYSPDDPAYHKHDETIVPIYQAAKAFKPLVIHALRENFFASVFTQGSTHVAAIDPKTYKQVYIEVSDNEVTRAMNNTMAEELIDNFQNAEMRVNPVTIKSVDDKDYYLGLLYDTGGSVFLLRNIDDFKLAYQKNQIILEEDEFNMAYVRPLTYLDMMYLATVMATQGRYCTVTRYPAIELGSIYPSKVKVMSTTPSREVIYRSQYNRDIEIVLPHYPIINSKYLDSVMLNVSQNAGLNADHDGDTVSINSIMSEEGTEECREYGSMPKSMVTLKGTFMKSADTKLTSLTLFNLTRIP